MTILIKSLELEKDAAADDDDDEEEEEEKACLPVTQDAWCAAHDSQDRVW